MARTVITVYDMIHERFDDLFARDDMTSRLKMEAIRRADHIICISECTRNDLLALSTVESSKVSTIHLAPSLSVPVLGPGGAPHPRPYILYVGYRLKYKNFGKLLCAYARTARLMNEFDLVCFGGGQFSREENDLMMQMGIPAHKVTQLAGDDELLTRYYQAASVYVCPSLYEGFGFTVLEAMACGCPVICSSTGSLPEVAGDAAEYFDPYDAGDIGRSLADVLYSATKCQELVRLGKERAKCFSWYQCARQTAMVYAALH